MGAGPGSLQLSGNNSFSGGLTLNSDVAGLGGINGLAATLIVDNQNALGYGTLTLTGGSINFTSNVGSTINNIVSIGAGPTTFSGTNETFTNFATISAASTLTVNNNITFSNVLNSAVAVVLAGTGA